MKDNEYPVYTVEQAILCIRGQKVILDTDLALIYGVATKVLNQAVKRNSKRFPPDFLFQLDPQEVTNLKSQFVTSSSQPDDNQHDGKRWSQFMTSSSHGGRRKLPYAFTEHGAIMAATVLNSPQAVEMSVFVVRAFIKMREQLVNRTEMEKRLAEIEKGLLSHDAALRDLYSKIRPLLLPPPVPPKKPIGFQVRERRARYGTRKSK